MRIFPGRPSGVSRPSDLFYIEIELDAIDAETRGETDRLVSNYELRAELEREFQELVFDSFDDAALVDFGMRKGSIIVGAVVAVYGFVGSYGAFRAGIDQLVRDMVGLCRSMLGGHLGRQVAWTIRTHVSERSQFAFGRSIAPVGVGSNYLVINHAVLTATLIVIVFLLLVHSW